MANTLTGLIPTIYQALDTVSREEVGLALAVSRNTEGEAAAVDETLRIPVVPQGSLVDITAGTSPSDDGDQTIGYTDMTISNSKMYPIRLNGEEERALRNGGKLPQITSYRFQQAFRTITNAVEADLAGLHIYASRAYGTAGTTPFATTVGDMAQVRKVLVDNGASAANLRAVIDSSAGANLRTLGNLTDVNRAGTAETLRQGLLGNLSGFSIGESGQIETSTAGTASGAKTDNAGYAVGVTTLTLGSDGTGTLVAGDVITLAGDANKYVVVTGDADVSGGGTVVIAEPGLRVAITTAQVAITVVAAAARNMAFDQNAIQLITRAPAMPEGGDSADDVTMVTDPISGIAFQIAVYRQYRQVKYEVGLAWGQKAVKSEHIALLLG